MRPVCLVTGGAGKLGSSLCRALISTHEIAAVYRKELPRFPSQLRKPVDFGPAGEGREPQSLAFCVQGDLTSQQDIRRIVEVVLARFGRIDVVVNSAADTRFHGKLLELCFDGASAANQLAANCIAPMNLVSVIFQQSWKTDYDANRSFNRCVINVSSLSGLYVYPNVGQAFYSASKAALNFLTLHLAYELATYSVRVNAICPSRFPDSIPTNKVVSKVRELVESDATGQVVELLR
jgi:NAD(P)-dependent dehydrogenase (short-subunit alcohol dehydrogenase family)